MINEKDDAALNQSQSDKFLDNEVISEEKNLSSETETPESKESGSPDDSQENPSTQTTPVEAEAEGIEGQTEETAPVVEENPDASSSEVVATDTEETPEVEVSSEAQASPSVSSDEPVQEQETDSVPEPISEETPSPSPDVEPATATAEKPAESTTSAETSSEEGTESEDSAVEDFSTYDKKELLELISRLSEEEDYRKFAPILKEIKPIFDELVNRERNQAKEKYLADGGEEEEGFVFKEDEYTQQFYEIYSGIQKKRAEQKAKIENEREENYKKKEEILEKIRQLTESEESQASIDELKKLQEAWKEVGPVPSQHNRNLWASYNALIDLFYDKRSIYFELKELDRKKNLATKLSLCEKAEKLVEYESIKQSIKELNELHEEFKHIGPVPKEEQEMVWQRFKMASDKVYEKKREYIRQREEEKQKNIELKLALCEEVVPFADFQSDKMAEWNTKTKEILEIQKKWEAIRFIPREKIKELSKAFWTPFKAFFNNKNAFIRTLDEEREENLRLKTALCEEVETLVESDQDERDIADKLKEIQKKWKQIGAVPAKSRQSIYERFKSTCDKFFEQRRKRYADQEKEYEENLTKKKDLCARITEYQPDETTDKTAIDQFVEEWKNIGFVPKKDKKSIQREFETVIYEMIDRFPDSSTYTAEQLQLHLDISLFKDSPFANKKLKQKEAAIRRKISKLENDIDILKNNIGFLARSKKADKLKDSLEQQITEATERLKGLRSQLKVFREL